MKDWNLTVSEEAWGLSAFAKLLKRDKSKDKDRALKEMLFIWYYCDIKSIYQHISNDAEKIAEIKHDIGLPEKWEIDDAVKEAIELYRRHSQTVIEKLYLQSLKAAQDVGNYLENTDALLAERDANDKVVTDIAKITQSLERVPKIMGMLKAAYKEVIQEQKDNEGKKKGSKDFNMFEDGFGE